MKRKRKTLPVVIFMVVSVAWAAFSGTMYAAEGANPPQCAISIAFDDGTRNQFENAFHLMKDRGMVGTYYVTTDLIRDFSGNSAYMSIAEIQTLQSNGNEIGSHGKTHTPLNTLSNASIHEEFYASKQLLQSYGLTVDNLAYPHGATNPTVDSIAPGYYRSARLHRAPDLVMHFPVSQSIVIAWPGETGNQTTVLPRLKWMVDRVYSEKGWGIIYFHNVIPGAYNKPYTISTQDFAIFLDYILSKGIPTITVNQGLDADLASKKMQLITTTNCGTVYPASGAYNIGETVPISATPPMTDANERYIFNGWTGTGSGSYSGDSNPSAVTMNNNITQTASWRHEFKLTISTNLGTTTPSVGEYWFAAGSSVDISASAPIASADERYVWTGWSGTGSGSYSGAETSVSIIMNGPILEEASWTHQFFMGVSSPYGVVNGSGWFSIHDSAVASIDTAVLDLSPGIRVVFSGWSEDASGSGLVSDLMVVDKPLSAVALWTKQFLVVFNQTGLPESSNASVVINSENHSLPFSYWVEEGGSVQFICPNQLETWFGSHYVLISPLNQSSIEVDSPKIITAEYSSQYTTEFLGTITLPIAIAVSVGLLFRRRRKATNTPKHSAESRASVFLLEAR